MNKIRCIIVEDEKPAQEVLKSFIEKTRHLELIEVLDDAVEGLNFLQYNDIDLIFLDIQMPDINGVEFLTILKNPPQIIVTTAFSNYALDAFDLEVKDYLLKPYSYQRFLKAVNRICPKPDPNQVHNLREVETGVGFAFFNVNKTMVKVKFNAIQYVESMRDYVYIHLADQKVVTKSSLSDMDTLLGPGFLRIHRSYIINLDKVTAYNSEDVFINETPIPIGTNYRKLVALSFNASDKLN